MDITLTKQDVEHAKADIAKAFNASDVQITQSDNIGAPVIVTVKSGDKTYAFDADKIMSPLPKTQGFGFQLNNDALKEVANRYTSGNDIFLSADDVKAHQDAIKKAFHADSVHVAQDSHAIGAPVIVTVTNGKGKTYEFDAEKIISLPAGHTFGFNFDAGKLAKLPAELAMQDSLAAFNAGKHEVGGTTASIPAPQQTGKVAAR